MKTTTIFFSYTNKLVFIAHIFFIMLSDVYSAQQHIREPETYILPEGYVGSFYIIFNIPHGQPRKELFGGRVYEIPSSGLLSTQMDINPGWINENKIKFFYRLKNGALHEITGRWNTSLADTPEHRADARVRIFGGGIGTVQISDSSCAIEHQAFHVGTKKDILDQVNHFYITDIPDLLITSCK